MLALEMDNILALEQSLQVWANLQTYTLIGRRLYRTGFCNKA